jgi:hypothetical protein
VITPHERDVGVGGIGSLSMHASEQSSNGGEGAGSAASPLLTNLLPLIENDQQGNYECQQRNSVHVVRPPLDCDHTRTAPRGEQPRVARARSLAGR